MLLYGVAEAAEHLFALEHHRFAEQRTYLCAADVEGVAQLGEVGDGEVTGIGHESVTQTCTVDKEVHAMCVAELGNLSQFGFAVY